VADDPITAYWLEHYATEHCTLCGNRGVIDSRGVMTPGGHLVGRLNYCICPNGQALRAGNGNLQASLTQSPQRKMQPGDKHFMDLARCVGDLSKDRSVKVGCVFVSADGEAKAAGYNRFPEGVNDAMDARHERPEKYFWTEHAERNAIYNAAKLGRSLEGCTVYLPWFPCMDCARAIVQVGAVELVAIRPDLSDPKWGADFQRVFVLLEEAGIRVRFFDGPAAERHPG
jgi:dCMP deaminase